MMFGLREINVEQHHVDHVHVRVEYAAYSSTSPSSNSLPIHPLWPPVAQLIRLMAANSQVCAYH
jgi:hypothetical protein